jgi:hypothetical protein
MSIMIITAAQLAKHHARLMQTSSVEISIKGKKRRVPSARILDKTVVILGRAIKLACVQDEEFTQGQVVQDPELFIQKLQEQPLKADIFTFSQKLPETKPKYGYYFEWDNAAVVPLVSFGDWWEKRLPQETRKNVRRAQKRGVVVRSVELNDDLIKGITALYNSTPVLQGQRNAHYGKGFCAVKEMVSTFRGTSEFIGAFFGTELIGFIKLVHMGETTSILHILAKNEHYDKRPANALLAKAVEICCQKRKTHLVYGKYIYGKKADSSLSEFKARNGFEKMLFPRYYVPLSLRGEIAIRLRLHRGLLGILPRTLITLLLGLRAWWFQRARLA